MKSLTFVFVCLLAACFATPSLSFAQKSTTSAKPAPTTQKKKFNLTSERVTQLFTFVEANHPELKELLKTLESKKKWQYKQALMGLDKAVKKLEAIKKRRPKRYESALEQWKLESRIKVAAAQVKLNDTEEGRSKLETLVTQLVDFHINRLKSDKDQTINRLKQLEKKIADAESNREQTIEKRLNSATRKGKKAKKVD